MTPEERILRLENAFSTLAELAKKESEGMDEYKRRTDELAELAKTQNRRLDESERRTEELAEQAKAQRERTDNSERRIELLIDLAGAQNVRIKECERLMEETRQTLKDVGEAQKQTEAHLAVLFTIVAEVGRAQAEAAKGLSRVENSLASLNERFEQYISTRP
jgi:chromosome segregation ATPase